MSAWLLEAPPWRAEAETAGRPPSNSKKRKVVDWVADVSDAEEMLG